MNPIRYQYLAIDADGQRHQGYLLAANEPSLAQQLQLQGLWLLRARPQATRHWRQRLPPTQLAFFCLQMQALLQAGVPLLQALAELGKHSEASALAEAIQRLHYLVESGRWLSQAVLLQPQVFPAVMGHLLAAGEHSGELPAMFGHLAETLQWQNELRGQLWQGLSYPLTLSVVVLAAAVVMLTSLVPQLSSFLGSLGQTLPWTTQTLLTTSALLRDFGGRLLLGVALLISTLCLLVNYSPKVALYYHRWLLAVPILGDLLRLWILTRLSRFLGLMYRTGIPILQALHLCQPIVNHREYSLRLQQVIAYTESGQRLASSFRQAGAFPPLFIHMVEVGETTGALDIALAQLSRYFEQRLQFRLAWMLRMLEPALTVVMGLMLLFLMAAVVMPVYDSFSQMGGHG